MKQKLTDPASKDSAPPRITQNSIITRKDRRSPRRVLLSVHLGSDGERVTRTKQEFAHEVNINTIWAQAKKGIMPPAWMTNKTPMYGDFSEMPTDFATAFAQVERAKEAFLALPLEFRRAIDHDPRNLDKAPKALFEKFGLTKELAEIESKRAGGAVGLPAEAPAATPAADNKVPANKPSGAKKGTPVPESDPE